MTKIIAILGVDGAGKTTFLNQLQSELSANAQVQILKMPQYHLTPGTSRPNLSEALDRLSQHADRAGDPALKAMSLFLAMPLYGEAVTMLSGNAKWIISERHPLIDSIAYSAFYKSLMGASFDWKKLADFESIALVMDWAQKVMSRWLKKSDISKLPAHMAELFSNSPKELVPQLKHIYRCDYPDEAILIAVDRDMLEARLNAKGTGREIHEDLSTILMLQEALKATAQLVVQLSDKTKLRVIDASELKRDEILLTIS